MGIRDARDAGTPFVQPHPGGQPPLPGAGREPWLRLLYERG